MPISRVTTRQSLAALLRTVTVTGNDGQQHAAFASVYESVPDEVVDEDIPTCLINLGDDTERRLTDPVGFGVKELAFDVTIDIFAWVDASDDLLGQRFLDSVLDAVSVTLRTSPNTITGAVALAYDDVSTRTHAPIVSSGDAGEPAGKVLVHATRRFKAWGFDVG